MLFSSWLKRSPRTIQLIERDRSRKNGRRTRTQVPRLETLEERLAPANWSGDISSNTMWPNTSVQNVTGTVHIDQGVTLTIQAGTVVQFNNGTNLNVDGTLLAQGASGQPIYFTSVNDNSPTGGGNSASPGNWGQLLFTNKSTGSVLDNVVVRYGGSSGEIEADSTSPTISNSTISFSSNNGVRLSASDATLTGDTFLNNNGTAMSMDVASGPSISGSTLTNNGTNGVAVDGGEIKANDSWNNPSIVYLLAGFITVDAGDTLTIGAGQVIKFGGPSYNNLTVNGTLSASGTASQPIVFTASTDDSAGGDTNNDGATTTPKAGGWGDLTFTSTSTADVLDYVDMRYGGADANGDVEADSTSPTFSNCTFGYSSDAGVRLSKSNATLTNDTFLNNSGGAISIDLGCSPTISGSTLTNNGVNGVAVDGGTISTSVSWNNPSIVYLLTGIPTVAAGDTLTIGAGQIIKFGGPFYNNITVNGTLSANGTASDPVIFTASTDDSVGGDTNNDGTATSPNAGSWGDLIFTSTSTADVLDYVDVRYGGADANGDVEADSTSPTFSNCTFGYSSDAGVRLSKSNATLTNDTFLNNKGAAISMDLASTPTITTPTLTNNGVNGVSLDNSTMSANNSWNNPSIVYVVNGSPTVATGVTLTIGAGQIVKINGGSLTVNGTLQANGTADQAVTFTSTKDDSASGDTNNDGTATSPKANDWSQIHFTNTSTLSVLNYVVVRYGSNNMIEADTASPTISNSMLTNSDGTCVLLSSSNAVFTDDTIQNNPGQGLRMTGSFPILTGETIQNNGGDAISMDSASSPSISTTTVSNDKINGVVIDNGTISVNTAWNSPSIVYEVNGNITVAAGATLSIGAGQIVKFATGYNGLDVKGTLQASGTSTNLIVFTSILDDSAGGDTNNDGSATSPAAGNWNGLYLDSGSINNVLGNVVVQYGGAGQSGDVVVHNAQLNLSNSVLSNSSSAGLRIEGSTPTVAGDTFQNNSGSAIAMDDASTPIINGTTLTNNKTNGVTIDNGTINASITWDNPSIVYEVNGNITVASGVTLSIGAGQIIKFPLGYNGLTINGTLQANGAANNSVVFTSITDDLAGGDTNNDGNKTVPVVANWNGLYFAGGSNNVLDDVVVRYGGSDMPGEIYDHDAGLTLSGSMMSNCSTAGLRIEGSSPTLADNTFEDNYGDAISMDDASSPVISGTTLDNNQINGVSIDNGYITANTTWNNPSIVYAVNGSITVNSGVTLSVGAGQIVKFPVGYNGITVNGTLLATGTATQSVIFTSLRDDSTGNDTNNDGSTTSPAPGNWLGLSFSKGSSGNVLNAVDVRYGGSDGFVESAEVDDQGSAGLTVSNSVLSNSALAGLGIEGAGPTVTGNTFSNNALGAVSMDSASDPSASANSASGNGVNGIVVSGGTLSGNLSLTGQNLNYSLNGSLTVPQGDTLTIAAGTVFAGQDNSTIYGNGTIANAGTFLMASADGGTMDVYPQIVNTGTLEVRGGTLNLHGNLTINGSGVLTGNAGATLKVAGNLGGNVQNADLFSPPAVILDGSGTASSPQTLEVMSQDQGDVAAAFTNNFAYYSLALANGTRVQLVDTVHNSQGTGAEALYVDYLYVPSGTTLDLNGLHAYARIAVIQGTVVGGTVTTLPSGGALTANATSSGSLVAGDTDDWTFFGHAGMVGTIVVNTGSAGLLAPLSPSLNFATVTIKNPALNVVATQTNTVSGRDVIFTGVDLSETATYQVQVSAGQSGGSGNYNITLYDATPQAEPLPLGQTTTGTIDNPYRVDNFTFTGTAGQTVQFNLINSSNPAVQFDLTGPSGYTAFVNATTSSGKITLPSAGTYTLTVHGSQHQTGSYAFQIVNAGITDLTLGAPFNGTIQGSGQSQIFQLTITQPGQVNLTLTDNTSADENELYANLGTIPTRGVLQPLYYTGASASKQLSIPTAAPGTYYILVYTAFAPAPSSFTLEATEASVFLNTVTPNRSGTAVDTTLTLSGVGFDSTATVSLLSSGGTSYAAGTVSFDSPTQLTATFPAGTVPAGTYTAQVSEDGGATATLASAITIDQGGQANFNVSVVIPNGIGNHATATVYVEYSNTGDVAMPAPLLVLAPSKTLADGTAEFHALLTQDASQVTQGYWTSSIPTGFSNSVELLASGATPGVLNPGESERVPVYYAGWQQPWDATPAVTWNIEVVKADETATFDWADLKQSLPATSVPAGAWDAIFANWAAQSGATWGAFVSTLDRNAAYLGQLGENVTDFTSLLGFELAQADGLNNVPLASSQDISVPVPGLGLAIDRSIFSNIDGHYVFGPFGYGWALGDGWGRTLAVGSDGTVTIQDSDGAQRIFQPDSRGNDYFAQPGDTGILNNLGNGVFTLTEANRDVTEFQNGTLAYVQDANGNRVTAGYTNGLLTSLTDGSGASLDLSYNTAGLITSITNSVGQTAHYSYDAANQYLLSSTDYEGFTTTYSYAASSNPAINHALDSVTYPDGTENDFSYDALGRFSQTSINNGSEAVSFSYPALGAVASTGLNGATTTVYLDYRGLAAKVVNPLGQTIVLSYDSNGNLIQATDPAAQVYSFAYDSRGNIVQTTDPLGQATNYTFGPLDTVTSITDPKGNTTTYRYDQSGDPLSTLYANGTTTSAAYNSLGQVTQSTDANGKTTSYQYNSAGQLLSATDANGSMTSYSYDSHGNLTSASDGSGTINFYYNSADLLTEVDYPNGTYLKYSYDSAGLRIKMVDETGFTVNYSYDALGHLAGLTDGSGNSIVSYSYDSAGNLSQQLNGDGSSTLYTYDLAGKLLSVVNRGAGGAITSSFVYIYNNLGLATSETTIDGQWTYTYDADAQLTQAVFTPNASNPDGLTAQNIQYVYDAAGNRISETVNGVLTTYQTNNVNQYTSSTTIGAGTTTYQYDANGNLISRTDANGNTTTYSYDLKGNLIGVSSSGSVSSYQYNALGARVAATVNGQTTQYLLDPTAFGNIVGQFDGAGNLIAHYTFAVGLVSQVNASNASSYYSFEANGNTASLIGSGVANRYTYLPFGGLQSSSGSANNPFTFSGQLGVTSASNGMFLMPFRSYDTITGRFMQSDPIGIVGGLNFYAYTANDPVNAIDPSGLIYGPLGNNWAYNWTAQELRTLAEAYGRWMGDPRGWRFVIEELATKYSIALEGLPQLAADTYGLNVPQLLQQFGTRRAIISQLGGGGKVLTTGIASSATASGTGRVLGWLFGWEPLAIYFGSKAVSYGVSKLIDNTSWKHALDQWIYKHLLFIGIKQWIGPVDFSVDPNALLGPSGFGDENFVPSAVQDLPYTISFENAATATAPAQRVVITDHLDPNLDWSTLRFTEVAFGDNVITVPTSNGQFFQTTVAMTYNGQMFDVMMQLAIDLATGLVTAIFQSINPQTQLPPDVLTGFLPPEDGTGRGMGHIGFLIDPKAGLPTGTQIRNVAVITFDQGESIATNQVNEHDPSQGTDPNKEALVTIDAGPPTSNVTSLPATSPPSFTLSWSGQDDTGGSGVATYTIYESVNGGSYAPFLTNTTATSATFTGTIGDTYSFYSIATDNVGNVQPTPTSAQASTTIVPVPPTSSVTALPTYSQGTITLDWTGSDVGGPGIASYTIYDSVDGGPFTAFLSNTTLTSTTFTGANGHTYGFYSIAVDTSNDQQPTPSAAQATTTVDTVAPTSSLATLPTFSTGTINLSWSGADTSGGSGIASYTVYVSEDNGPFTAFLSNTTLTSTTYAGQNGLTYQFYTLATDNAGNQEATPSVVRSTTVDTVAPTSSVAALPTFSSGTITLNWSGFDNSGGSGIASYTVYVSEDSGPFTAFLTTTALTTTYSGVNGHTYQFYTLATDNAGNQQTEPVSMQSTTVDTIAPTSTVAPLPATENTTGIVLNWSGSDNAGGSRLASYTLFVSDNNGMPTAILSNTQLTTTVYQGLPGHHYGFYTIATDNAGNTESTPIIQTTNVAADAASQLAVTLQPPTKVTASAGFSITVKAEQTNGQVDPDYNGPITLALNGSARLAAPTTVVASAGVATFTGLVIDTAGSGYMLQANAAGVTSATTNSFSVTPAAATQLVVVLQPSSSVKVNTGFNLAVAAEDAFGNIVSSFSKPIGLTLSGGGKLIGTTSSKPIDGAALFTGLIINTAGNGYTLKATSGSLVTLSHNFAVTAGAATHLVVTTQPPANVTAGTSFGVTVSAEDAFGNVDPTFTGSVALTLSGSAMLDGTTSMPAVGGMAAFSGLSIGTAGNNFTLQASAPGLTSATSSKLNVAAINPNDQLVITMEPPMSVTAGSGFTVVVKAESDEGMMVDTHFSGAISLTLAGPARLAGPTTVTVKAGVATLSGLSIGAAGSGYSLVASALGLTSEPTNRFAVTPGTVTHLVITTPPPGSVTAGSGFGLTVSAEDTFGNVNPGFSGMIKLALARNPTKALLNGMAAVIASDGVATLSGLTINNVAAGYALTASSGKLTSATTGSLTVTAGTATQLVVTSPSQAVTSVKAGSGFAVTVKAEDAFGNVDPTFNGAVSLALQNNPGNALLHGPINVIASGGVAVFTGLSLNTAAVGYTLAASSGSLTSPPSKSITITPAAATQLAVTSQPPASVKASAVFGLTIAAEDAFGNVATSFTGSVSLTLSGGATTARLAGSTSVPVKAGVATFKGLTINLAASGYVLKASSRGLKATGTNGFDVTM